MILKLKGILISQGSWEQEGPFSITMKDTIAQPGVTRCLNIIIMKNSLRPYIIIESYLCM